MSERLLRLLGAEHGIVCAVGAGGKKTTLYALAAAHPGRVAMTATVFMTTFSRRLAAHRLITGEPDLVAAVAGTREHRRVAYARPSEKSGRVAGIPPELIAECHARGGFDVTLVKADGARMRAIKAPAPDEPVIPGTASTVLSVVSAAAIGAPLDERIAHRPERIEAVTGLRAGDTITPDAVGRLLAADRGGLQGIPDQARVIAVINAVDDAGRRTAADEAARVALRHGGHRIERVVLTCHRDGEDPVVDAIDRE
jgi:probable selenium-dependent hydroxylase accessory protein YqeC